MKRFKRVLLVLLAVIICVFNNSFVTSAASVTGRTEGTPIDLNLGKSKSAKFQKGIESVYFWVELKNTGKLKVSFSAENLGTGVTMVLHKQGEYTWKQSKALQYKKSTKTTSGTLTSEYILPSGGYIIEVTPDKSLAKTKKFKMTTKFTEVSFDDKEPNNTEEQAQSMTVQKKDGSSVSYQMFLSTQSDISQEDLTDCFHFKLKEAKKLQIKLKLKERVSGMKVLLRKKATDGYELIAMYDITDNTLDKKLSLKEGTYYLKVWYDTLEKRQVPYTISATVIESVKKVSVNKSKVTLWTDASAGKTSVQLKATVNPANASNKKIKWTSSNQKVAKVSASGKVTAVAEGTATVKVTAQDGSKKYASCKVTVKAPKPEPEPTPTPTPAPTPTPTPPAPVSPTPVISGGTTVNVGATVTFTVTNGVTGGTWYSTDTSVLSGSGSGTSCTMVGKKAGTATVYYIANGKKSNTITVRVRGL